MNIEKLASKTSWRIPFLQKQLAKNAAVIPTIENLQGFYESERLALQAVKHVGELLQPGWSEKKTADILHSYLRDYGVKQYFHRAFVWFGERTKFHGINNYSDYSPTNHILGENDVFILDIAPIYKNFTCDIGYTNCKGNNSQFTKAKKTLDELYIKIPKFFQSVESPTELWDKVDQTIQKKKLINVHKDYPFGVLGHRVHISKKIVPEVNPFNFGLGAYTKFLSKGLFSQLLNRDYHGPLYGLWAIEPHLANKDFGFKFEYLYLHSDEYSGWLQDYPALKTQID